MAVEVITHGNFKLIAKCPKCGCVFSFLQTDLIDYITQLASTESIHCPDCDYKITWNYGEKSGRYTGIDRPPGM